MTRNTARRSVMIFSGVCTHCPYGCRLWPTICSNRRTDARGHRRTPQSRPAGRNCDDDHADNDDDDVSDELNTEFLEVIRASPDDQRDLFTTTARRMGTNERNVEKDFWVCWTLDALFNGRTEGSPRLLFKGGTSLSKAFGLIGRFSEDIDIVVFREDLGFDTDIGKLEAMGLNKRKGHIDAMIGACHEHISGSCRTDLESNLATAIGEAGVAASAANVAAADEDGRQQTLLLRYRSAIDVGDGYVQPVVRIECGARSALDPHGAALIVPYVSEDLGDADLTVPNVTTVDPGRTFWDKVVILHGLRNWFDRRNILRQEGQRISRHYYDVHQLLSSEVGKSAVADRGLGMDSARHARMFFYHRDFNLDSAVDGRFTLTPSDGMIDGLRSDYDKMSDMIFGDVPDFDEVIASVRALDTQLNS
jgi:hypothetical protein